jgi:amino acid permease
MTESVALLDPSAEDGVAAAELDHDGLSASGKTGYKPPPRRSHWLQSAAIIVAELVGTGLLGLPYVAAIVGLVPAVILLLVFAVATLYPGLLLWRLRNAHPGGVTYGDLARAVVGPATQRVVFVFIYTAFFGNMALLLLTASQMLQNLMCVGRVSVCCARAHVCVYTCVSVRVRVHV